MTSKSKSKSKPSTKKTSTAKTMERDAFDAVLASLRASTPSASDRRKELLARVAGSIAGHIISAPPSSSESSSMASSIATIAVDVAEEILLKAGIPIVESRTVEASFDSPAVDAAS